jgi:hypothetical protein
MITMKPLNEMSNSEFAELLEYIVSYSTSQKTKTAIDFTRAYKALAGIEALPDDFKFFDRTSARELLGNSPFMYAVYDQMIERLQPLEINLTDAESRMLESYAQYGRPGNAVSVFANLPDSPIKVTRRLFDLGLIDRPAYHGEMSLTTKGTAYLEEFDVTQINNQSSAPKGP